MTPGDEFWTAGANMSLSSSAKLAPAQKEFVAEFSQDNSPLQPLRAHTVEIFDSRAVLWLSGHYFCG